MHAWIDATAGVAGDMLLAALLDAGADLEAVRAAVRSLVGESVAISVAEVTRAGLRAAKAEVAVMVADQPHRTWADVRTMIDDAGLAEPVRRSAQAVFARLATAEGRVHGIPAGRSGSTRSAHSTRSPMSSGSVPPWSTSASPPSAPVPWPWDRARSGAPTV